MESKDELLLLIDSLSGSEKRYLRIRLDRGGDAQLSGLFDLLVRSGKKSIQEQLQKFLPEAKTRSRVRRKLYDQLLDGLSDYELKHNPDLQIYRNIQRSKVLLMRGLHDNAEKLLSRTLSEAEKYDRKAAVALLAELQCNMEGLQKATRDKNSPRDALFQQSYLAATEHADLRSLYYKDAMLAMTFNHEGAVGEGARDFLTNIQEQAGKATHREGFFFPYLGLNILANLALLKGDEREQRKTWDEMSNLFEANPHMIPGIPDAYQRVLHYRSLMAIAAGDAPLAKVILEKLREQKPARPYLHPYWFQLYYCTLGQYAMNVGDEAALHQFLSEVPAQMEVHQDKLHGVYTLLLKLLMAVCHFMAGNYRDALHWIHGNLNEDTPFAARKSGQILATLRLLVYVETGELDTLEMMLEKTRLYLGSDIPFPRFWEISRRYFLALIKADPAHPPGTALREFAEASAGLFAEPAETNVQAHFDFPSWAEARLSGKSMVKYVAEHFGPPDRSEDWAQSSPPDP